MVLDFSTTTHPIYKTYQELAERLVGRLKVGLRYTRVALVVFSSVGWTQTKFDLDRYDNAEDVIYHIRNLQYTGGTTAIGKLSVSKKIYIIFEFTGEGITEAMKQAEEEHGARPKLANKMMAIFTDGWNNKGPEPDEMSKKAQALGFEIFSIGVKVEGICINLYIFYRTTFPKVCH